MTVAEGLIHPWITEQAADVPLSTGGWGAWACGWGAAGLAAATVRGVRPSAGRCAAPSPAHACAAHRLLTLPQTSSAACSRSRTRTGSSACS